MVFNTTSQLLTSASNVGWGNPIPRLFDCDRPLGFSIPADTASGIRACNTGFHSNMQVDSART
jgi:hypothetical protein